MFKLNPDPGVLPTRPAPRKGERISIRVAGLPPYKELRASIRNPKHRFYSRFVALRNAAFAAMDGRAWSNDAIAITLEIRAPHLDNDKAIADYLSGVLDTVDGSHGESFTYLPVCFQDDCQVVSCRTKYLDSSEPFYELEICFDPPERAGDNSPL